MMMNIQKQKHFYENDFHPIEQVNMYAYSHGRLDKRVVNGTKFCLQNLLT